MTGWQVGGWALVAGLLITAYAVGAVATDSSHIDLHKLWEDRCGDCHGHAGDFARERLRVHDGVLVGAHPHRDLSRFLSNHYLAEEMVSPVHAMLLAQASTEARFESECSSCHGKAAEFVRQSLLLRDGMLWGRRSEQSVETFLQRHRDLSAEESRFFQELLERVAAETRR